MKMKLMVFSAAIVGRLDMLSFCFHFYFNFWNEKHHSYEMFVLFSIHVAMLTFLQQLRIKKLQQRNYKAYRLILSRLRSDFFIFFSSCSFTIFISFSAIIFGYSNICTYIRILTGHGNLHYVLCTTTVQIRDILFDCHFTELVRVFSLLSKLCVFLWHASK